MLKQHLRPVFFSGIILLSVTPVYSQQNPPPPPPVSDSAEAAKVAQWVRDLPAVTAEQNHFSVIGGLSFMQMGEPVLQYIRQKGMEAFYADSGQVQIALQHIQGWGENILSVLAAGGIRYLRDVQNLPWGAVEYAAGKTDFTISDALVQTAEQQGMVYVGTVMPYASWDLVSQPASADEMCLRLMSQDFFYLAKGGMMDRYINQDAFLAWLAVVVERYDADGTNDMAGLATGIKYWQIHNEPEGDKCGLFRGDAAAFVELMQRSYETVKAACPDCQVINGGAGIPLWRNVQGSEFWPQFVEAGGAQYVDIIAIHYNNGKVDGGNEAEFTTQVTTLRELMGTEKPVWLTEFGALPRNERIPNQQFNLLPETEAAAWYVRFYTVGLANGVTRFFSDAPSFVFPPQRQRYLTYYIHPLLEAKIGPFSSAEMLTAGQYKFIVNGSPVYVLWSGVPAELTGSVRVTDMYGSEQTMDAAALQPDKLNPLIVEQAG